MICGSGALAREVYCWVRDSNSNENLKFKGFLDRDPASLNKHNLGCFYLGHEDSYRTGLNDRFLIAIGDSAQREKLFVKLRSREFKFMNFIHDSVLIGGEVMMGEGNIICPNTVLTTNINIGHCNIFNIQSIIGHDVMVGSYNTFSSNCDVTGGCVIGDGNFLGSRVSLLPKCRVGSNSKVAAGSVVYKGVRSDSIYAGNPAKKVGFMNEKIAFFSVIYPMKQDYLLDFFSSLDAINIAMLLIS